MRPLPALSPLRSRPHEIGKHHHQLMQRVRPAAEYRACAVALREYALARRVFGDGSKATVRYVTAAVR